MGLAHPQLLGADGPPAERGKTPQSLRLRGVRTDFRRFDVVDAVTRGTRCRLVKVWMESVRGCHERASESNNREERISIGLKKSQPQLTERGEARHGVP